MDSRQRVGSSRCASASGDLSDAKHRLDDRYRRREIKAAEADRVAAAMASCVPRPARPGW